MYNDQDQELAGHKHDAVSAVSAREVQEKQRGEGRALNELEYRVCEGLRAGEFHLMFQGAYHAGSGSLSRIGTQLRWMHPEYGLLFPGAFQTALKHPQVALEMVYFVARSACRALAECLRAGLTVCPVVIHVSPAVVVLETFAGDLERIARSHGVSPSLLEIELAESGDAARVLSVRALTGSLRDAGFGIALGEFGSGYASLASLGALDVDTVTLARELLNDVPRDRRACAVISVLLTMFDALDVRVVVDGVERAEQAEWLGRRTNVLVQGGYLARPVRSLAEVL